MKAVATVCIGVGVGSILMGGMDLFIHTTRPELADFDSATPPFGLFLAGKARAARRIAPIALALGMLLLVVGLVLVLTPTVHEMT